MRSIIVAASVGLVAGEYRSMPVAALPIYHFTVSSVCHAGFTPGLAPLRVNTAVSAHLVNNANVAMMAGVASAAIELAPVAHACVMV